MPPSPESTQPTPVALAVASASGEVAKRPKRKWQTFFFVVVALGVIGCGLWWLFRQPSQGSIVTHVSEPLPPADSQEISRKTFDGKYVTFSYDARYLDRSPRESVKNPIAERFFGARNDIEGQKLSLVVQDNSGYAFEEYSAYRIREMDQDHYAHEKITLHDSNIHLFETKSPVYEVAAFLQHHQLVASLVLSSPTSAEGLRAELIAILETWHWRDGSPLTEE